MPSRNVQLPAANLCQRAGAVEQIFAFAQPELGGVALGEVIDRPHITQHLAAVAQHRARNRVNDPLRSAVMADPELHGEISLQRRSALPFCKHLCFVIRVQGAAPTRAQCFPLRQPVNLLPHSIGVRAQSVRVSSKNANGRRFRQCAKARLRCRKHEPSATRLQSLHRCRGQQPQHLALVFVQSVWHPVYYTQGPDMRAIIKAQRGPCIEADVRCCRDQRVVGKARICAGIRHLKNSVAMDGVGAKGQLPWSLTDTRQTHIGLEPLTLCINQADKCNGHPANEGGRSNQCVKFRLGRGVQHSQRLQRQQAFCFVGGQRGRDHSRDS